ncbi:MAG: hypothetical protein JW723_12825 [Bacteroidales bacterium]|nr:hypothetical protein [Bacteroidales bacterium]
MKNNILFLFILFYLFAATVSGQVKLKPDSALINGLKLRSIGPAMASGRIADFAVNPLNSFEYYVAVASGHIWKTTNNGITWKPVFDKYDSYAIGCLAIDPNNPNIIWAGTGENNSQRALGYGNGVYKSLNEGKSWTNMGLKTSRQIGKMLIDPRNSDVVYVAAEGSVWGPGGERGIYKTTDGGKTWIKVLEISENTGAYDLEFHPSDPDIIYATLHQRRRRTFTKINGGPESAFYKSTNAGKDWRKITKGLPEEHLGRIGLAVTPANDDLVYAIIEAADDKGGFFRSADQGESWEKMSDYTSSGQYYTEIYCDPVDQDKIYSMDTYSQVSHDAGKTWKKLSNKRRHVDDHALWINPEATGNIRIGGDGGVYESFDGGETWQFTGNLPVTQFYRVNADNSEPFYYVYGGTQDNNTMGGPSQNTSSSGVANDEWFITIGGDGFWVATDPEDPNIVYSEYQYGNAYRFNRTNGEVVYIKPQERENELTYKWNWDTPLILSHFSNNRLYMAANKVFMSEDRGDSWKVLSGDLTAQKDRNDFRVMGKFWSSDAVAKDVSTSQYGTLVSLAESPLKKGMLYTGSDDGVIQITEDNGDTWRKISSFPGVPQYTYVSDIAPSNFDENVVYATFNNTKSDDFKPYILMSKDKGKSWSSISSNLPEGGVYTVVQDYKDPEMLFCGTEYGLFVTFDNGKEWLQFNNGLPDIAVRDLVIQKRECDLVLATFGRGFYILHDYGILREIKDIDASARAYIFNIKDAKLYVPQNRRVSSLGDDFHLTENLPFGAEFTCYLKDEIRTSKEKRQKIEKELFKEGSKIDVNSWEDDRLEKLEEKPYLIFVVEDNEGNTIRKIAAEAKKGINRAYWDLKYPDVMPVKTDVKEFDPVKEEDGGIYAMPGSYYVSLFASEKGRLTRLTEKRPFEVVALETSEFNQSERKVTLDFQKSIASLYHESELAEQYLTETKKKIQQLKQANFKGSLFNPDINNKLIETETKADDLILLLKGYEPKASREEIPPSHVPIQQRLSFIVRAFNRSSEAVSKAQKQSAEIVRNEFADFKINLNKIKEDVRLLEDQIINHP